MKRRNFFSKIGKCLLGLVATTALPESSKSVETPSETTSDLSFPGKPIIYYLDPNTKMLRRVSDNQYVKIERLY